MPIVFNTSDLFFNEVQRIAKLSGGKITEAQKKMIYSPTPKKDSTKKPKLSDNQSVPIVPDASGVYIVGVKIQIDNKEQFCPLYVGKAANLNKRILAHWKRTGGYLNQKKELFDYINKPIANVYQDIHWWNLIHWNFNTINGNGFLANDCPAHAVIPQNVQKIILYNAIATASNSMVYFNCKSFFDFYLNKCGLSNYVAGGWHDGAKADLDSINSRRSIALSNKIEDLKISIDKHFYFAYVTETDWNIKYPGTSMDQMELATKCSLEKLGIFTICDLALVGSYTAQRPPLAPVPRTKLGFDFDYYSIPDIVNINESPLIFGI